MLASQMRVNLAGIGEQRDADIPESVLISEKFSKEVLI